MKALVLEQYNRLVYKDVPDPEPSDNEVLVRVIACGICGSDVHGLDGSTGRRIPPMIMGHEASGIIERTGRSVHGWKPGDRVTFDSTVYPLDDWYTLEGRYNLSDNREVLGVSPGNYRRDGAFAEFVVIPQHILYRIPENVSFEQAAMTEAVAVALHAVNLAGIRTGSRYVVTGAGMIGICIIRLLRLSGASVIIAIDINPKRLELASASGAALTIQPGDPDMEEKISLATGGRGADVSFEAVGINDTVLLAVDAVRKGGTVVLVGNVTPSVQLPLQKVVTRELRLQGSCAIRGEYETVLELLSSGRLKIDDLISVVAPLEEGALWFDRLYRKTGDPGKVILKP